jgi:hypothetical protein
MVTDIVQTAVCAFDGIEFTRAPVCGYCGGHVQGYDTITKKFVTIKDIDQDRVIRVKVKRFTCQSCKRLCYAGEPFYPDTRLGSIVIDLYTTLSATMPHSRAARVIDAIGIRVDRTSWRNYHGRRMPEIPRAEVFGMQLPLSVISLSALVARTPEGGSIDGEDALAACGFPSTGRAASKSIPPAQETIDRDQPGKE